MDAVWLARLQFAMTIGFHFIFPPVSIGLAWLLVAAEWMGWRRGDAAWRELSLLFAKLLGLTFAMGVATGVVMEFQFGTNWSGYSRFVGDIFGSVLAAEGILAFFLESGFLGLYLFGRQRVSPAVHWFSILMVAVGATISAFWIIVANSWQQTPAGYVLQNGRAELAGFAAAVLNPSTIVRFSHTMMASILAGVFVMAGICAWRLIRNGGDGVARKGMVLSLVLGLPAAILVAVPTGDAHARQVARSQEEKFATIEGLSTTRREAPLLLFGIPVRSDPPEVRARLEVPGALSWLVSGDVHGEVTGLDRYAPADRPPFALTFITFHTMVGLGGLFIVTMLWGWLQVWRGALWRQKWFLWLLVLGIPLPVIACELGWTTAEVGRQPWIVYHLLRTPDGISATVPAWQIAVSMGMLGTVYLVLGLIYLWLMMRVIRQSAVAPKTGPAA